MIKIMLGKISLEPQDQRDPEYELDVFLNGLENCGNAIAGLLKDENVGTIFKEIFKNSSTMEMR